MNKYYAEVNGKIEFFDKLPYRTYFMYGEDGIEHRGNAYLSHTKLDGGLCLTPIYEVKTKKIHKRIEYAGIELRNIPDFKE